jgi:hypothetical protein
MRIEIAELYPDSLAGRGRQNADDGAFAGPGIRQEAHVRRIR